MKPSTENKNKFFPVKPKLKLDKNHVDPDEQDEKDDNSGKKTFRRNTYITIFEKMCSEGHVKVKSNFNMNPGKSPYQ